MSELDDLMGLVIHAADSAAIDASRRPGVVNATITREAVKAAFECALGNGLIGLVDRDRWPEWVSINPPFTPGKPGAVHK